jgi:hypothetical protein
MELECFEQSLGHTTTTTRYVNVKLNYLLHSKTDVIELQKSTKVIYKFNRSKIPADIFHFEGVPFIVSLILVPLFHRKPASTGTLQGS